MWRLLDREHKLDTAMRTVGLLERVMDDQLALRVDFSDWFLSWLDLVGECEQARGRMIDDDKKVAVMLICCPKELREITLCSRAHSYKRRKQVPCDATADPAMVLLTKSFLSSKTANGNCCGEYYCWRF